MAENTQVEKRNATAVDRLKAAINVDSVQQQFKNALDKESGPFLASVLDLYASDTYLQACEPKAVLMECLKAASLKLPINKQLGFAYVIPYKDNNAKDAKGNKITKTNPQFQIGYKGYIQLAMRTGVYRYLNAGVVCEGQTVIADFLTGKTEIVGEPTKKGKPIGYFAYMELLNGFSKTVYMTKAEVEAHGKKYSKSYGYKTSAWKTDFDAMAMKTVIRRLLTKYGIMSVEMVSAFTSDFVADNPEADIAANANTGEIIDVDPEPDEEEIDNAKLDQEIAAEEEAAAKKAEAAAKKKKKTPPAEEEEPLPEPEF